MKNAKKVLAMVIVLALAISMAIPAMADTLTVQQATKVDDLEYTVWEMATLSYSATNNAYRYQAAAGWAAFFQTAPASAYFSYDVNNNVVALKVADSVANDSKTIKEIADAALLYAKEHAADVATTKKTQTSSNGTVAFGEVGSGYFLVDSPLGSALMVDTAGDGDGNLVIREKNDKPVLTKKVKDADATGYVDAVDVAIGDTVSYKLTVEVKKGATNYSIVDVLPQGIEYADDMNIQVQAPTGRTITVTFDSRTNTFNIDGEDFATADGDDVEYEFSFTYDAIVTGEVAFDAANQNRATLKYGDSGEIIANEETASVWTWTLDLIKYAQGVNFLAGAEFEIYDVDPTTEGAEPLTFTEDYVYDPGATPSDANTKFTTNGSAALTFKGLDSDKTYYFKEVTAPEGYNLLTAAVPVAVTATTEGENMVPYFAVGEDDATQSNDVNVENKTGTVLPSTGGTGTVIFVTVGSILVLAMGVLLVVRKRMSKVVYAR